MESPKEVVMTLQTSSEECVSVPIYACWHCQLETDFEGMPVARSPRTSPGAAQLNMFGLLLRLDED
jgi:hypothetical protein